jgi:hypothetical protein
MDEHRHVQLFHTREERLEPQGVQRLAVDGARHADAQQSELLNCVVELSHGRRRILK